MPLATERKRALDANEFCLVLTPTWGAATRASQAVLERFGLLAEGASGELAAVVADLVETAVARRPGPITVSVALVGGLIRGEVADHGGVTSFEIPLAG